MPLFKRNFLALVIIILLISIILRNNIVYEPIKNEADLDKKLPKVYYINLAHRIDRNKQLLEELKNINYPNEKIIRVDAIFDKLGSTGCGLSHIKAFELGLKTEHDIDYIMVLEDDFRWKYDKKIVRNVLSQIMDNNNWNVILLACNGYTSEYNTFFDKVENCQTTSGYIIKIKYIPKLLEIWKRDMEYRKKHHVVKGSKEEIETCIDQSWKRLQNESWFITKPILGNQRASYSDIQGGFVDYKV